MNKYIRSRVRNSHDRRYVVLFRTMLAMTLAVVFIRRRLREAQSGCPSGRSEQRGCRP